MPEAHQRIIVLNTAVSRSATRARDDDPPPEPAYELMRILEQRHKAKVAVEFFGAEDSADDAERLLLGASHNRIRLKSISIATQGDYRYATLLLEHLDMDAKQFPVVDAATYQGREIEGEENERGATTTHVVFRVPGEGGYDDSKYRCAIEATGNITRYEIGSFINRQLKRHAKQNGWTFGVEKTDKKGKKIKTHYKYWPKIDLLADVGRALKGLGVGGSEVSSMVFTKRHEKRSTGDKTSVKHENFLADVTFRVTASQGPDDPIKRKAWLTTIKDHFALLGYETRLYFKHSSSKIVTGGEVHKSIEGALDLVMCPKEPILLKSAPKDWLPKIDSHISSEMRKLLDRDELWEHSQ
jgi:hypothetical protein